MNKSILSIVSEDFISFVIVAVVERIAVESYKAVVVEEAVVQKEEKKLSIKSIPELKISQPVRKRDDDWFVLLDVPVREPSFVPPGIANFLLHSSVIPP